MTATGRASGDGSGLRVEGLSKTFSSRAGELRILDGIDLELQRGETLAVVGPSGSGKSTLLHIIGTLDRPTDGRVRIGGVDPFGLSEPELARFRNRTIGFVFQDHHLLPQLTVIENVLVPALASREPVDLGDESVEDRARRLLDRVGLTARRDHVPAEISGGERQRAAIARSLVLGPELLLCDEPTGNLDRGTAGAVGDLLMEVHREERTMLVVVTHSAELAGRCDRRAELDGGRLRW